MFTLPTVGSWANKDCTRAFDKRPVCKRPMTKNPDTTPPGIIDDDQKETNIKYCGAPQWRWNSEFKSCYNVLDISMPWEREDDDEAQMKEPAEADEGILDQGHAEEDASALIVCEVCEPEPQLDDYDADLGNYEPQPWIEYDEDGNLADEELRDFLGPTD